MTRIHSAPLLLLLGACATATVPDELGEATVEIRLAATAIPLDGECARITATRLADFHVTSFRGVLSGAVLRTPQGEHRVTATAYPQPCNQEPAAAPWNADEQIAMFASGPNVLVLNFKKRVDVDIDANFEEDALLSEVAGSRERLGRNNEDTAAATASQIHAIDGWEVKLMGLPASGGGGTPSESVLFSTQVVGATPYSPRGLARTSGYFYAQVSETLTPIARFASDGTFVDSLAVVYPETLAPFDFTDGIEAIDDTHLVRTGCDGGGECSRTGLEILELRGAAGSEWLEVVEQIEFADQGGIALSSEYPVGVTAHAGGYLVTTLPFGFNGESRLVRLDSTGTLLGSAILAGSNEGVSVGADGRLAAMTYGGIVTMHDPAALTPRAGETLDYTIAPDVNNVSDLSWDAGNSGLIVRNLDGRIQQVDADWNGVTTLFTPTGYDGAVSMDLRGGLVALMDRFPGAEPFDGPPTIELYSFAGVQQGQITLSGVPLPLRPRSFASLPGGQLAVHYRRPGDPSINAAVYVHNADGTLAHWFDLRDHGFTAVVTVNHLPASDELAAHVGSIDGITRIVVTDRFGNPRRSYRTDAVGGVGDLAPITTGPYAGQTATVVNQPTSAFRLTGL